MLYEIAVVHGSDKSDEVVTKTLVQLKKQLLTHKVRS